MYKPAKSHLTTHQNFRQVFCLLAVCVTLMTATTANAANHPTLPLLQIEDLQYQGAFIIPNSIYGESGADYVAGPIEYKPSSHTMFIAGKKTEGAIAEFSIPDLVNSTDLSALNSSVVLQDFRRVLELTPDSNPQGVDRITGIELHNGRLIVSGVEFYDAPANNTHTSLVIEDASDIANSTITGYYELQGAAHIAGWMSDVPPEWQASLGGAYLAGSAPNYSINGRYPQGPTAFIYDPSGLSGTPGGVLATTTLLDSSLSNPLYADFSSYQNANYNVLETNGTSPFTGHTAADIGAVAGSNNLWTERSNTSFGFIVPGTSTYLTVGSSGGHQSGIGYKATPNGMAPYSCPGPCAYDPGDYYNYYWLWDVNQLLAVKDGLMQPYDVRPYASGEFDVPFQVDVFNGGVDEHNPVTGGTYDQASGLLYLMVSGGDSRWRYGESALIVVYKINNQNRVFTDSFESNPD